MCKGLKILHLVYCNLIIVNTRSIYLLYSRYLYSLGCHFLQCFAHITHCALMLTFLVCLLTNAVNNIHAHMWLDVEYFTRSFKNNSCFWIKTRKWVQNGEGLLWRVGDSELSSSTMWFSCVCLFTGKRASSTLTLAKVNRKFVRSQMIEATISGKLVKTVRVNGIKCLHV